MKGRFERNPYRELPDGTVSRVFPFHLSLEGLDNRILCREDADYDLFVKVICVCARRKNVILVMYVVVSNHAHCVLLARSQTDADAFGEEVKRMISMHFCRKYGVGSAMQGIDVKAIWLDNDSYLRNAIAYVIRNAMDNGAIRIQDYAWTGFRGIFCGGKVSGKGTLIRVCNLSKRERRAIMHTDDDLRDVRWLLNDRLELEPVTICDWRYVEAAYKNDQSFFMRMVGSVNCSEMGNKLVDAPRVKRRDIELFRSVNEISQSWFQESVDKLSMNKKAKLLTYVAHSFRTDPSQLARVFSLDREDVLRMLSRI